MSEQAIREALERLIDAKPDPVFTAAFDTLRKGAPGLSETTCGALARSIAIKVQHGAPDSIPAALADVEAAFPGAFWVVGKGKMTTDEPMYGAVIMFGSNEVLGDGEADTPPAAIRAALAQALGPGDGDQ